MQQLHHQAAEAAEGARQAHLREGAGRGRVLGTYADVSALLPPMRMLGPAAVVGELGTGNGAKMRGRRTTEATLARLPLGRTANAQAGAADEASAPGSPT